MKFQAKAWITQVFHFSSSIMNYWSDYVHIALSLSISLPVWLHLFLTHSFSFYEVIYNGESDKWELLLYWTKYNNQSSVKISLPLSLTTPFRYPSAWFSYCSQCHSPDLKPLPFLRSAQVQLLVLLKASVGESALSPSASLAAGTQYFHSSSGLCEITPKTKRNLKLF